MVNFTGANLTKANLRGADLSGMVNFDGAVLHDVDFTGAITDKALIKLDEADIHNAKGLPSLQKSNEYLEALKSFSKAINQQFKSHNISPEQLKPIEESIKELVKEVEDIKEPEKINNVEKKNLHTKFTEVAQKVIQPLPKTSETLSTFTSLEPLNKLLDEGVPQLAETIMEKEKEEDNKTKADNNAEEWYKQASSLRMTINENLNLNLSEKQVRRILQEAIAMSRKLSEKQVRRILQEAIAMSTKQIRNLEERDTEDILENAPTESLIRQQALEEDSR
jgi:hypothetical protein